MRAARRARALTIQQGLFTKEVEITFEFLYHFDAFTEWTSHLQSRNWGDNKLDQPLVERVGEMLRQQMGKIVMREVVYATRLRRVESARDHG